VGDINIEEFECQIKFTYLTVVLPFKGPWEEKKAAEKKATLTLRQTGTII